MFRLKPTHILSLKILIHIVAILPLLLTYYQAFTNQLGAYPIEALLPFTGIGAINLLLLSLLISPVAKFAK
jgi:sulfoxide reductase heme-binding subunit YedZ